MKIIGFSGKKQSGKTTAANFLCKKLYPSAEVDILSFATALKELVFQYFVTPTKEFEQCVWEPFLSEDSKQKTHPCGKTYRELLQMIGMDWFRSIWPEIWIENYKFKTSMAEVGEIILTPDVRFPNEVKCIQDLGGHVIRLLRAPFPEDKHESETALDNVETFTMAAAPQEGQAEGVVVTNIHNRHELMFDAIIDNGEMSIEQQNEAVWKLVNERNWI